jgi:hypothetical protein
MAKQDNYVRYTIRVPQETYSQLEKAAAGANRSANAEIVGRLEQSVEFEAPDYQRLAQNFKELQKELKQVRAMNAITARMITRSDADLTKHLVISRAFCLAILNNSDGLSEQIRKLIEDMHDVYRNDFSNTEESERISLLREIAGVPKEDMDFIDSQHYLHDILDPTKKSKQNPD